MVIKSKARVIIVILNSSLCKLHLNVCETDLKCKKRRGSLEMTENLFPNNKLKTSCDFNLSSYLELPSCVIILTHFQIPMKQQRRVLGTLIWTEHTKLAKNCCQLLKTWVAFVQFSLSTEFNYSALTEHLRQTSTVMQYLKKDWF